MNVTTSGTQALAIVRTYCSALRSGDKPTNPRAAGRLLARFHVVDRIVRRARGLSVVPLLDDSTPLQDLAADALETFEREAAPHLLAMLLAAEPGIREEGVSLWGAGFMDVVWPA